MSHYNYVVIPDKGDPVLIDKQNDKQAKRYARKRHDKRVKVFYFTSFSDKSTYRKVL